MTGMILEIQADLHLESRDIDRFNLYINHGLDKYQAATQLAQDLLGNTGADVQYAKMLKF